MEPGVSTDLFGVVVPGRLPLFDFVYVRKLYFIRM